MSWRADFELLVIQGGTQGSGTEFGLSIFTANATDLAFSFLGNNESLFRGDNPVSYCLCPVPLFR